MWCGFVVRVVFNFHRVVGLVVYFLIYFCWLRFVFLGHLLWVAVRGFIYFYCFQVLILFLVWWSCAAQARL